MSCDGCWAVRQKAGGRTRKNLKIRLQTLFQEKEGGCTSPGTVPPMRRVALSCSLTPAALSRGWCSLGMLHPSAPAFLAGCQRGRLLQMAEEPPRGVTHGTVLAHHHTMEGCYLQASHGALQKAVAVVWLFETKRSSLGSIALRPVPCSREHARAEPARVFMVGPSAAMSSPYPEWLSTLYRPKECLLLDTWDLTSCCT